MSRPPPPWIPRVLREPAAAEYVGLSPGAFRRHVVPAVRPIPLTPGRQGWLREDLDAWIDARAGRPDAAPREETGWDDLDEPRAAALRP